MRNLVNINTVSTGCCGVCVEQDETSSIVLYITIDPTIDSDNITLVFTKPNSSTVTYTSTDFDYSDGQIIFEMPISLLSLSGTLTLDVKNSGTSIKTSTFTLEKVITSSDSYDVKYNSGNFEVIKTTTRTTYSTEEQLTGETWIDGKPIYSKTYIFDSSKTIVANQWTNIISDNTLNVLKLLNCKLYRYNIQVIYCYNNYPRTSSEIDVWTLWGDGAITGATIEYTKTTD